MRQVFESFSTKYPKLFQNFSALALLLSLPLLVFAALTVQNLQQKASGSENLKILDVTSNQPITQTTNSTIKLQITLPSDWKLPNQSSSNSLIQKAYASHHGPDFVFSGANCTNETVATDCDSSHQWCWDGACHVTSCPYPNTSGQYSCSSNSQCASGWCNAECCSAPPDNPQPTQPPQQPTQPPASKEDCIRNKFYADSCSRCAADGSFKGTPGSDFGDDPAGSPVWCSCAQNHRQDLYQQYCVTQEPTQPQQSGENPTATSIPNQLQSTTKILKRITIQNIGSDKTGDYIGSDLLQALAKPIEWELIPLRENEQQANRVIQVTLSDGQTTQTLTANILLKKDFVSLRKIDSSQSITELTQELSDTLDPNNSNFTQLSRNQQITTMITLAKERKEKLLEELRANPQTFLQHATLGSKKNMFPEEVKPFIEQSLDEEGTVAIVHMDNFKTSETENEYYVIKENAANITSQSYHLNFVNNPANLLSGNKVRLSGIVLDSELVVNPTLDSYQVLAVSDHYINPTGEKKVAVLLVNSNYDSRQPFTKDDIKFLFDGQQNNVEKFFQENSFGKLNVKTDVFGWFSLERDFCDSLTNNEFYKLAYDADIAAYNSGVNINSYAAVVYAFPSVRGTCGEGYAGTAWGAPAYFRGGHGYVWWPHIDMMERAVTHELGHSLELGHANALNCGSVAIDKYSNCRTVEYGDFFSNMGVGAWNFMHLNALEMLTLGWIDTNYVKDTNSGIYTIIPFEENKSGLKVIRIPKSDTNEYYYISYPQKKGFNNAASNSTWTKNLGNGVTIHVGDNDKNSPNNRTSYFIPTKIINPQASSSRNDFSNAILYDGKEFYDPINLIKIKQIGHDVSGAIVEISKDSSDSAVNTLKNTSGHTSAAESNPIYILFTQCFKEKADTTECPNKNVVDYDKDNDVDEQDYKMFLQSL